MRYDFYIGTNLAIKFIQDEIILTRGNPVFICVGVKTVYSLHKIVHLNLNIERLEQKGRYVF